MKLEKFNIYFKEIYLCKTKNFAPNQDCMHLYTTFSNQILICIGLFIRTKKKESKSTCFTNAIYIKSRKKLQTLFKYECLREFKRQKHNLKFTIYYI